MCRAWTQSPDMPRPEFSTNHELLQNPVRGKKPTGYILFIKNNLFLGPFSASKSFFYLFIYFFFCLLRAAPAACGGSQARGLIGAVAYTEPQQHQIQAASATYTAAHGNTGSSTH